MIHCRRKFIWLFLGSFLLYFGFMFSAGLMENLKELNGSFGIRKLGFCMEGTALKDMKQLEKDMAPLPMVYTVKNQKKIQSEYGQVRGCIVGVSQGYKDFNHIRMASGSFFRDAMEQEHSIVLEEDTAYQLFHSIQVVGLSVWIDEQPYHITGIVKKDQSFLADFTYPEKGIRAYVTINTFMGFEQDPVDSHVQIAIEKESKEKIKKQIIQEGRKFSNPVDPKGWIEYEILYQENQGKISFMIGILGIVSLLFLGSRIYLMTKRLVKYCRNEMDMMHWKKSLQKNRAKLFMASMELGLCSVICIVLLDATNVQIDQWIKEIGNWNIWQETKESVFSIGSGIDVSDRFWMVTLLINGIFLGMVLLGIALLWTQKEETLWKISGVSLFSIVLVSGILYVCKLPIVFHWQQGMVIWSFLLLTNSFLPKMSIFVL